MAGSSGGYPNFDAGPGLRDIILLASAARLAEVSQTTAPNDQVNPGYSGVLVTLDITAASGTGGLVLLLEYLDKASAKWVQFNAAVAAKVTTGTVAYEVSLNNASATGSVVQRTSGELARRWRARVTHGDGSSYTYSLGASYLT